MTSTPLDYGSPDAPQSRRRWPWRIIIAVGVLLMAVLALPAITVRQVESRMDAVTGSITWKTVWLFGITSGPRRDVSPLESRLKSSGITWTPSSHFLHNTHHNVFGAAIGYECGSAPPIYRLRPVLNDFTGGSTDTQLREFVRVMQFGTEAEQSAAVDAASENDGFNGT